MTNLAYSDDRWLYYQFSSPHLYIPLQKVGRIFELGSESVNWTIGTFPDPFLRSIAYWVKQDYDQALETLMFEAPSSSSSSERKCNELAAVGNPDIFNFFLYLRTHPLLKRRRFKHAEPDSRKSTHAKVRARSASSKSGLADEVRWVTTDNFHMWQTTHHGKATKASL